MEDIYIKAVVMIKISWDIKPSGLLIVDCFVRSVNAKTWTKTDGDVSANCLSLAWIYISDSGSPSSSFWKNKLWDYVPEKIYIYIYVQTNICAGQTKPMLFCMN